MNDTVYGFRLTEQIRVDEIDSTLYLYEHQSGARLIYSSRADDNKTFAIAFPTIPTDDTGVFHVLEHSVLCGSEKYPLKDPFSELLKGSLKTFLNAFTYPDKTVYPASSRCEQDFINLIDVYMDAVLNPLVLRDERIFMQEGIHFDYEDDRLSPSGVVYSEMQGAYSSPDELGAAELMRLIYPSGTYGYDSGGRPDTIPRLTHRDLCLAHEKFYHPSNAYIFLDGSMDIERVLRHIDGPLSRFEKGERPKGVDLGSPVDTRQITVEYAASDEAPASARARVLLGFRGVGFDNKLDLVALSVITAALTSGNNAPLRKRVLDTGICESLLLYTRDETMESSVIAELRGVKPEDAARAEEIFFSTLRQIIDEGIPDELIDAELSVLEFTVKERDFGSYPKGLAYATSAMDSWIYGGRPELYLAYNDCFAHLRKLIGTDYYARLTERILFAPRASLTLLPSATVAERDSARLAGELDVINQALSEEEREQIRRKALALDEWQSEPDCEDALSTIPALTIDDVPREPRKIPTELGDADGVTVISHPIHTGGIVYAELYFDVSDVCEDDLYRLTLLSVMFTEVGTELGDAGELRVRLKKTLGSFSVSNWHTVKDGKTKLYIVVRASMLKEKVKEAAKIIKEVLYTSDFTDTEALRRRFVQLRRRLEESMHTGSHALGMVRGGARYTAYGAVAEKMLGVTAYENMKLYDADPEIFLAELSRFMTEAKEKYFRKGRLTLGITAAAEDITPALTDDLTGVIMAGGSCPGEVNVTLLPLRNEGISTTSSVGYTVYCGAIPDLGKPFPQGGMSVAGAILDYELLWNEIRVKGGAYGTGFINRAATRGVGVYSYRDPSPERTALLAPTVGDMLREFAKAPGSIEKYLIGAIGDIDRLSSPAQDGGAATLLYLSGRSYEDTKRDREDILSFDKEGLLSLADEIDSAKEGATLTVMASRDVLSSMGALLDEIIEI